MPERSDALQVKALIHVLLCKQTRGGWLRPDIGDGCNSFRKE